MNYFDVEISKIKKEVDVIDNVAEVVGKCSRRIDNVLPTLNSVGLSSIVPALNTVKYELDIEKYECNSLKSALLNIILQYVKQEIMLAGNQMSLGDIIKEFGQYIGDIIEDFLDGLSDVDPYEVDSILFDGNGEYGGDQGAPRKLSEDEKKELYELIQDNIPHHDFTQEELEAFLERANSEGCGYVALTNSIFMYYENNPDGFEEAFGYPMYNEDGDLNYNMLFIDLYSSVDGIHPDTGQWYPFMNYDAEEDGGILGYNQWMDETGNGTGSESREYYINQFMEEHGVESHYDSQVNVTPQNFQEISESGQTVIIRFHHGNIYDSSGEAHAIHGGHAMVVTGVTGDGRYIVSSWGDEYYIDPNENAMFLDDDGNTIDTSFSFDTVTYE
ncbi:MAG: hypothetical protein E7263_09830 [Lachnospiraceae bacterium]|nr:hypothetical protein [Lachnospiraceae bacterium]